MLLFVLDTTSLCGKSLSNQNRIVGGENALPQQWPWQVSQSAL